MAHVAVSAAPIHRCSATELTTSVANGQEGDGAKAIASGRDGRDEPELHSIFGLLMNTNGIRGSLDRQSHSFRVSFLKF